MRRTTGGDRLYRRRMRQWGSRKTKSRRKRRGDCCEKGREGERVEIGAAITDGCKAIHGKLSNEFIALIGCQPSVVEQKRVRAKIAGVDAIRG